MLRREPTETDRLDSLRDRHIDAVPSGQLQHWAAGLHALGHLTIGGQLCLLQRLAAHMVMVPAGVATVVG